MIKAVLFDFGGVLTEGGKMGAIRSMFAQQYGVAAGDVQLDESVKAAFRGVISDREFIETTNRLNPQCSPTTMDIFVNDAGFFQKCDAVYGLASRLRAQGIVTGVFSNVFATVAAVLRQEGYYDGFSPLVLSCDHGMMKPERPLYVAALRELHVAPEEVLFIDDKNEFLVPARELGMHTILAISPRQIVADTEALIAAQNGKEQ